MNQKKAKKLRRQLRAENVGVCGKNGQPVPQRMLVENPKRVLSRKPGIKGVSAINHPLTFRAEYQSRKRGGA